MNNYLSDHLKIAHCYFKMLLLPTDNVIDATCGNGKDAFVLAKLLTKGRLFCYDIQKEAILNTASYLTDQGINMEKIILIHGSHESFSQIPADLPIKLVCYNLGYLPGGDKKMTTTRTTSTKSIKEALERIIIGGAISIMSYSGHEEGKFEEKAIFEILNNLDKKKFKIVFHLWPKKFAPSLIWIEKKN